MRFSKTRLSLALPLMMLPATAHASIEASFIPPAGPQSALTIDLPDDTDVVTLTTLGVELNGTDITAMLTLNGVDFVYTPVEPLDAGTHTIRLYDFNTGGEIASWAFEIEQSTAAAPDFAPSPAQTAAAQRFLRGGSVNIDTLTEASNRTLDHGLSNSPKGTIVSGAGRVDAEMLLDPNWQVRARGDYMLQTDKTLALTGNTMDLAEYEITADYTGDKIKGGVTLGHHDLGLNSYLFSGFYRRGASVRIGDVNNRVQAGGFAFRPESVTGARDFTGLNDNDTRLEGVTATIRPFSKDSEALRVTGIYYSGQGDDGGTGTSSSQSGSDGSGWGVIAEKSFGQERVKLRAEFAQSEFDESPAAATQDHASDALSLAMEVNPFRESLVYAGKPMYVTVGARYERIDTFFESLANPGLAADRNAVSAYSNMYWGGLSANLQLLHELSNVDDRKDRATDRLRTASLGLSYNFDQQTGDLSWLGSPYMNFNANVGAVDRMDTPDGLLILGTNNYSDSYTFGGGSSYESWYWSASHTLSQFEDFENNSADTVNNFTSLYAGWNVHDRLSFNGGVQFGAFRDEDNATSNYDTIVNFGANAVLMPDKLEWDLNYNLNLSSGSGDTPDRHIVNSEAEYTLLPPGRNRPGVALAIRGQMEDSNGNANSNNDRTQYQIFSVLRVKAPVSFGF